MDKTQLHIQGVIQLMIDELYECHNYEGDYSDLGNEIGYALGKSIHDELSEDDIKAFMAGFKHGINLNKH